MYNQTSFIGKEAQDLPLITRSYLVSAITSWPKPVIVRISNSPKVTAIVISSKITTA